MKSPLSIIGVFLGLIATTFYLFPVYFVFFPSVNTKMALAACGLVLLGYRLAAKVSNATVGRDFLILSAWALGLSIASYITMVVNNTHDGSFLSYIISMWVWLGGAYMLVNIFKCIHGYVGVRLVCNYIIGICVLQCVLALVFQFFPNIDAAVSLFLSGDEAYLGVDTGDRLHGFGAALDVAGLKFAAAVSVCGYLIATLRSNDSRSFWFYMLSFIIIAVIGNMISRTTTIGVILGLLVIIMYSFYSHQTRKIAVKVLTVLSLAIPLIVVLYQEDPTIRKNIEFGFEGFFSLAEKGEWQSNSNDILRDMLVFPDNVKTWLIGDGYAANPLDNTSGNADPYYTGPSFHGFYMQTDIGYCRFIFYFGLVGLCILLGLFITATKLLIKRFYEYEILFILLLCVTLIGWCKVSTDIFAMFAPFLCISCDDNDKEMCLTNV